MIQAHDDFVVDPKVNGTETLKEPEEKNVDEQYVVIYKEPQEVVEKAIAEGKFNENVFWSLKCFSNV